MAVTQVFMLGRFDIWCNDARVTTTTSQKACELVAYLLIFRDTPHHRDRLAALLWEDASPTQARTYLRKTLWQIQSSLPEPNDMLSVDTEWIEAQSRRVSWLDLADFEHAYQSTKGITGPDLTEADRTRIQQAVALYRGDLLEGWYQDWCLLERERLLRMNLIMLDKLVANCLFQHDFESGVEYANQLLRWDRARERTHYDLMCLYAMAGERTAVLNQFELCRAILHEELGVEPSPQTVALYENLRTQHDAFVGLPHQELHHSQNLADLLRTLDQVERQVTQLRQDVQQELKRLVASD